MNARRRLAFYGAAALAVAAHCSAAESPGPTTFPPPIVEPKPRPVADLGEPLVPGETIQPIDLPSALRLAGARDLDVAIARERVGVALADLDQARVLWLPSLFLGPDWTRHDGQLQNLQGRMQSISKSSLFLGGSAAAGVNAFGPILGGGPGQNSGLFSIIRISDAIFTPLAARQDVAARQARLQATSHDAVLGAADAYFDLQLAAGRLAIAREAAQAASTLADVTDKYVRAGAGLDADYRRGLTERDHQRRNVAAAVGQLEIASAELVRRLRLDPLVVVAPVEPPETLLRLFPDTVALDDLIARALHCRPELAEAQALVQATLTRLKQAKLRPLIPSLAFRYSGGGFGGGPNATFGNFNARNDAEVSLFWELQNLGLADHAIARGRAAEQRVAALELLKVQDRVASEVVTADKARRAADRQLTAARPAVLAARQSLAEDLKRTERGAGLPLEALQPIQALARARADYLEAVLACNRAQFHLQRALGQP